ncbi:MAG: glycosyltransferase family 4 protein [Candidatus Omnitrophota bacterium]|nr:MAG: glycosyltransferase family 4 protein [Candidatus Omnitrophota bacterium]
MKEQINILFLDHQAQMGGGEFSLMETIKILNKNIFNPIVMLGTKGPFRNELDKIGINTEIINVPEYFRTYKRDPSRGNAFSSLIKSIFILPDLIKKTEETIKRNKADIVAINTIKSAFFGIPAAQKTKVKSVWIIRDCLTKDFYRAIFLREIKRLAEKVDKIICTSEEVKRHFLNLAGRNSSNKVTIVYNGVDLDRFNPALNGEKIREELLLRDKYVITLIGRLEPWKGQKVFIRAAKTALEKRDNLRFFIVGGALFGREAYENECLMLVKKLGVEGKVLFLGFRNDVPNVIVASDVIVHTSILPEPFGRGIIEAMACAKPVISTNIGGPREILTPETGIFIEPNRPDFLADEIIKLIDETDRRLLLGSNARERVERMFDIRKTTQKLENIIKEIAQ